MASWFLGRRQPSSARTRDEVIGVASLIQQRLFLARLRD